MRRLAILACAIGSIVLAGRVCAQSIEPITERRMEQLIGQLSGDEWARREGAERMLMLAPTGLLPTIESRLAAGRMSPEQRIRLQRVGLRLFSRLPRAAMGIQFANRNDQAPAEISTTLPDFDASRVLRGGDVITRMDGQAIRTGLDLRSAIISHDPGELVGVTVTRDDRVVQVSFALGSYARLNNAALNEAVLAQAWRWRLARRLSPGAATPEPPIEPPFESPDGRVASGGVPSDTASRASMTVYQLGAVAAVAAGRSHTTPATAGFASATLITDASDRRPRPRNADRARMLSNRADTLRRRASMLQQQIAFLDRALESADDPEIKQRLSEQRIAFATRHQVILRDILQLQRFIDALGR